MTQKYSRLLGLVLAVLILSGNGLARAQESSDQDETRETRLVQINLLAASKSGNSDLSDLPANTRKAIEDIQDFLPFKSYKILDTSLVRALVTSPRRGGRRATTFMTGPDGAKLQVKLSLTGERDSHEIYVNEFEVAQDVMSRFRPMTLTPEQQRQVDPDTTPAIAPRADLLDKGALISTSFTANIGQTVVVGSSRLNGGDEALIVLFTALP